MKNIINKIFFALFGFFMAVPAFAGIFYDGCDYNHYHLSEILRMIAVIFCLLSVIEYFFDKKHRKLCIVVFVIGIVLFLFEYFVIGNPDSSCVFDVGFVW